MNYLEAVDRALDEIIQSMPGGGEERPGQRRMTRAVAETVRDEKHLVVQAGTGTGKTLAYLLPIAMSGKRTVIATFTKALQDQMVDADLPFLRDYMKHTVSRNFVFAELKGWSNYLCLERLNQIQFADSQGQLDGMAEQAPPDELNRILEWSTTTTTGDKADLNFVPKGPSWRAVSVSSDECLGATDCPFAPSCFPLEARKRAAEADVTVVNHALYALDLTLGGVLLGDHDVLVLDEAHQIEDSFSEAFGFELPGARFTWLADLSRKILGRHETVDRVSELGHRLVQDMTDHGAARVHTGEAAQLTRTLELAESRLEALLAATNSSFSDDDLERRRKRLVKSGRSLQQDVQTARQYFAGPSNLTEVGWIELSDGRQPSLKFAPIDIAAELQEHLWGKRAAVLTSATIPSNIADRLGLSASDPNTEVVESPFDYENQTLLYCAAHLPDPGLDTQAWLAGVLEELESLICSARGRTLALFTSYATMEKARNHLRRRIDLPILCQGEMPEKRLLEEFSAKNEASLLATRRFWQGIDVPGPTLSLVAMDRLPFPSPTEHLIKARSASADPMGWWKIELPICATRLTQGAGRLIRRADDWGVVAILDRRLATRSYKRQLLETLPPMRRTKDLQEVKRFLKTLDQ